MDGQKKGWLGGERASDQNSLKIQATICIKTNPNAPIVVCSYAKHQLYVISTEPKANMLEKDLDRPVSPGQASSMTL